MAKLKSQMKWAPIIIFFICSLFILWGPFSAKRYDVRIVDSISIYDKLGEEIDYTYGSAELPEKIESSDFPESSEPVGPKEVVPFRASPPLLEDTTEIPYVIPKVISPIQKKIYRPEDIPETMPWEYYGPGTLKDHIHWEHGVPYASMAFFLTKRDLKKLHSYLHNGGTL